MSGTMEDEGKRPGQEVDVGGDGDPAASHERDAQLSSLGHGLVLVSRLPLSDHVKRTSPDPDADAKLHLLRLSLTRLPRALF